MFRSCTHTNNTADKSWWEADFDKLYAVNKIVIYNRVHASAEKRINGAKVMRH